jgi:hypothetical protein
MIGAIVAWGIVALVVGIVVGGFIVGGRRRRNVDDRQFALPTGDTRLAAQTELQREHIETIVNRQNVGPGGL